MTTPAGDSSWTPRPDPTLLTTQQLLRELSSLRELFEARLDGIDKATELLSTNVNRTPTEIQKQITHMSELTDQKFVGVSQHFDDNHKYYASQLEILRSTVTEQFRAVDGQFAASKIAVDAALTAQKEAVGEQNKANDRAIAKSETAVKEQLTSLGQVSDTSFKAMEDKITDARDRLTVMESLTRGIKEASGDARETKTLANSNMVVGVMALTLMLSAAALIVSILVHVH
jgi:hypothetical protein